MAVSRHVNQDLAMTPSEHQEAKELFGRVLDLEPHLRASTLDEACVGRPQLRREVESLLVAYQEAGLFIDAPLVEHGVSPEGFGAAETMLGRTLGPYRIEAVIGEGGMGVVYRALDSKLNRPVAIKVLSGDLADRAARRRFQREAQMASSLNHPHILTVHDAGEFEDRQYLVTELVDGGTLRDWARAEKRTRRQIVELLVGVADGLAAAHTAGILHRDIKPANILVARNGYAKLADFGLAKLEEHSTPEAPTRTLESEATESGLVRGTIAYMSPEQASGRPLDSRSDIFSFGVVLYELLAGRRPFEGATDLEELQTIIHGDPRPLGGDVPMALRMVVEKALEKDPSERYQSMRDLVVDLRRLTRQGVETASPRVWKAKATLAVAALVVAASAAYFVLRPGAETASPARDISFTQLTDQAGVEMFPSLSPDGRSFAYAARPSGNWDIYLQRVGGKNPINLTKDSSSYDDTQPAFSPDGEHIAFRSERKGGGIFVMGATGESVRRLTDFGFNPAWSPDGKEIVFGAAMAWDPAARIALDSQLWVVNASSGEKRMLTKPAVALDAVQPNWSPHGHRIAFWAVHGGQRDIWTVSSDGTHPVAVTHDAALDWSPVWSPDGRRLYFASDRAGSMNLWRVSIDEKSGRVLGRLEAITTPSPYSGSISISRDGRRIAYAQQLTTANIQTVGFDPINESIVSQPRWITQGSRQATNPGLSPDGEWLAFHDGGKQGGVFVVKTDGTGLRQLTNDVFKDRHPRWSPDGQRIAFQSNRGGKYDIWLINPDGAGLDRLTYAPALDNIYPVWSPDGKRLAYSAPGATPLVMEFAKPWKEQSPKPAVVPPELGARFYVRSWSPDGRKLAGELLKGDGVSVLGLGIYSLESERLERLNEFGYNLVWLGDSRRLLFQDHRGKLYLIDSQSRNSRSEILSVAPHTLSGMTLSRDDRRMYFSVIVKESDIWLATLDWPDGPG
jgi:Tol biopolymer transport system component/predicted Ser/Thr protein kinase